MLLSLLSRFIPRKSRSLEVVKRDLDAAYTEMMEATARIATARLKTNTQALHEAQRKMMALRTKALSLEVELHRMSGAM